MIKKFFIIILSFSICNILNADAFRIYFENDFPFDDDSDYTNGARFEYQYGKFNIFFEQLMYSPENIKTTKYILGSHPYAGFLGIGSGYTYDRVLSQKLFQLNYFELSTGIVGPSSLAEETQKTIHKIIGAHEPKGWDNQLKDEFEIQGVVWSGYEYILFGKMSGFNLSISDEIGGYFGTMQRAVGNNAYLKLRYGIGSNLDRRPSTIEIRSVNKFSTFILVGNETRYWEHNVFLDGNRNKKSYSVEKEKWTTGIKTGIGVEYKCLEIGWFVLFNSREYKTQEHTPNYMSFQLGYKF